MPKSNFRVRDVRTVLEGLPDEGKVRYFRCEYVLPGYDAEIVADFTFSSYGDDEDDEDE